MKNWKNPLSGNSKIILPAAGLVIAFLMSFLGKHKTDFKAYRNQIHLMKESSSDAAAGARVA